MMRDQIILMGVSGCGKSTLGAMLSEAQDWPFIEGDDFHCAANRQKMASGKGLDDGDRKDWIADIRHHTDTHPAPRLILACSSLTPTVQSWLRVGNPRQIHWFHLAVTQQVAEQRIAARKSHFVKPGFAASQFAALSVPADAHILDATQDLTTLRDQIINTLI